MDEMMYDTGIDHDDDNDMESIPTLASHMDERTHCHHTALSHLHHNTVINEPE